MEEFKNYMDEKGLQDCELDTRLYMQMVCRHQQAIIDNQAAEIAVLRKLLNDIVDCELMCDNNLYSIGLIDENGNPTPLLTGINEDATDD